MIFLPYGNVERYGQKHPVVALFGVDAKPLVE
jgi:hypothetical protein